MSCPFGGEGGAVCSDFSIVPFDFDPSNRKLKLQLTSFGDRFREIYADTSNENASNGMPFGFAAFCWLHA